MPSHKWSESLLQCGGTCTPDQTSTVYIPATVCTIPLELTPKQLSNALGPAHMYVDMWLTLIYATLKPQRVQWDVPCRAHPRNHAVLFKLYDATTNIPNYHARIKAQTSLRRYAAGHGIRLTNHYVLSVPHPAWLAPMKMWAKHLLCSFRHLYHEWFSHHVSRLRIVQRARTSKKGHHECPILLINMQH